MQIGLGRRGIRGWLGWAEGGPGPESERYLDEFLRSVDEGPEVGGSTDESSPGTKIGAYLNAGLKVTERPKGTLGDKEPRGKVRFWGGKSRRQDPVQRIWGFCLVGNANAETRTIISRRCLLKQNSATIEGKKGVVQLQAVASEVR